MLTSAWRRRRCPHAAAPRRDDDGAQPGAQPDPDSWPRPNPGPGHGGLGAGHGDRLEHGSVPSRCTKLFKGHSCSSVAADGLAARLDIIRSLFRFGLPTGVQGIAMNWRGDDVALHRSLQHSAPRQALHHRLHRAVLDDTWTSVGLMALPRPSPGRIWARASRARHAGRACGRPASASPWPRWWPGILSPFHRCCWAPSAPPTRWPRLANTAAILAVSGFFITVALTYTGAPGHRRHAQPLFITLACRWPCRSGCARFIQATRHWWRRHLAAIVWGHFTRCVLTVYRFRQGKWRSIVVAH